MKRNCVCTLFWLLLVFSAIGQPYPFSEIQKLHPSAYKLMYVRELRLNDQHSRYYLACFMYSCWGPTEPYWEEMPHVEIIKEEAGQFTVDVFLGRVKERFSELEVAWEEENGEMRQTVFFNSYEGSHFYQQLDAYKQKNCLVFIADIDADGNEEILSFGIDPFNYSSVARLYIRKYIQGEWKTVFNEPFFGIFIWNHNFAESLDNGPSAVYSDAFIKDWEKNKEEARADEWFTPKVFPYDFVEYKGKTGLRIIFYDRDDYGRYPKRYYAQFWVYDEETQQYELVEDIHDKSVKRTPADGLLFAEARADLFWGSKTDFSKLNGRLTDEDLEDLDKVQLRIMRNAVYARHGRTFQSEDLQTLFNECSWYTKNPEYTDGLLTETDRYNIRLIQKYEDKQAMLTLLVAISFYILQTMALPSGIYVIFETLFNIGLFDSILAYVIAGLVTIAGKIRKKKETSGSLALVITGEVAMIVVILFFFALNLIFVMEYYYKNAMIALVVLEVGTMLITAGVLGPKVKEGERQDI